VYSRTIGNSRSRTSSIDSRSTVLTVSMVPSPGGWRASLASTLSPRRPAFYTEPETPLWRNGS
jgi:hypothetical protein